MSIEIRLVLAALACYRLAQLVTIDDGPEDMFRRLRERWLTGFVGGLVHCPYCLAIWLAPFVALLAMRPTGAGDWLLVVFGITGAQCWLQGNRETS